MDQQLAEAPVRPDYGHVDMETLLADWQTSTSYTSGFTSDFPALDNLVDAVSVNHQAGNPYVGDTTLAGLVRSIPRDSLQRLPIFAAVVNGSKHTFEAQVASFILRRGVFNEDTFGKGLLSTVQIGAEQALTHGYAPFMTATGSMFDEFGTTMRVLHYADVAPEPGIQDANESGYFYVLANLTPTRVRKILKAAQGNKNTSWDVTALMELLESKPTTRNYSIYQSDPRNKKAGETAPTYEFITKYEVGAGGEFVTFCPQISDRPLRVIENKSKFGYPRVQFLVIDPAPLSPFGVSRVRLASPGQNVMNAYYQNITSMLLLNSKPPVLVRGRFTKPVQLKQGAVWTAQDQNAKAELVTMDNGALQSFVPMAQQMISQINNMMGKPNKNSGVGNTAPGVKQQIKVEDNSTNQITNILENFIRQYALVGLDTHISEQSGNDILILDDEAKNAINQIGYESFVPSAEQPEYVPIVGDDNKLELNWEDFYEGIKTLAVEIELSMGKDELEEKTRGDLQDTLVTMTQNADPNDPVKQKKISDIEDQLVEKTLPGMKRKFAAPTPTIQGVPTETTGENQVTQNDVVR